MPARLHHERVAGASPARWLLLTHGIYGSGNNWRTIARQLVERRPTWGVILVDLRGHGRSEPGTPPHTLDACAEDVRAVVDELGGVDALAGHSFGGKVMLAARSKLAVPQTWVFDATPSARLGALDDPDNSVVRVLDLLARQPRRWARREDFVAAIVAGGQPPPVAQWLATSLQPGDGGGLELVLDAAQLRALLTSYFAADLWDAVNDPATGRVDLVVADRSDVFAADAARLAAVPPHVHVHHVDAGHWLHAEAPATVVDLLAVELP